MLTFETKTNRLEWFAQVILISVTPMPQNLRIGLRKRQHGKNDGLAKQRGGWPKNSWSLRRNIHLPSCHLPGIGVPAFSKIKPEEREFVVDSGASMHMISRKYLNSSEVETVRISKSPTTVMTVNGDVQTNEEATVYVKELDLFLTVKLLEDTPAVLSLGKLCDDHGYSYEWTSGHKPHLI